MSKPGETDYGKGSFPRTWNSDKFCDNFDEINWSEQPRGPYPDPQSLEQAIMQHEWAISQNFPRFNPVVVPHEKPNTNTSQNNN